MNSEYGECAGSIMRFKCQTCDRPPSITCNFYVFLSKKFEEDWWVFRADKWKRKNQYNRYSSNGKFAHYFGTHFMKLSGGKRQLIRLGNCPPIPTYKMKPLLETNSVLLWIFARLNTKTKNKNEVRIVLGTLGHRVILHCCSKHHLMGGCSQLTTRATG